MLSDILKRQFAGEEQLPSFNYHVTDTVVDLEDGRVAFALRLKGIPFELTSDNMLENQHDSLNGFLLSIAKSAGSRLAIWAHLDHYQTKFEADYRFRFRWMQEFNEKYMERFVGADTFENAFYLTFVLKRSANDDLDEVIREIEELQLIATQSLQQYEPEALSVYTHDGNTFSEFYEFIGYLYNGFWERIPVTSLPMFQTVQSSVLHHGYKLIETRFPDGGNKYGAYFDLKDFPEFTTHSKFNAMLSLNFPFILCFSFSFISNAETIRMIDQALNKMESAGDQAFSQMEEMEEGKGAVMAGIVYFGELHGALAVFGKSEKQTEDRGATARTTLSGSCATQFVSATISAPETFFSMFPGNVKRRPRPMPKTTRNLAGVFGMNTYSSGKQYGNPLADGSAVVPLQTVANGVYHFNFHYSMPGQDSVGEKRAGHVAMFGATGSGKTAAQTFLLSYIERFDINVFAIDKDGSMRGFIEANGGTYFRLAAGEPTGLNPFHIPDNPENRSFLYDLVGACGKIREADLTAEETRSIKKAVDNVFEVDYEYRRFSVLLQNIPDVHGDSNCLHRRLAAWCYADEDGRYAYALDNPVNTFDWSEFHHVGFDVTDFLVAGHPATEPILSYLFHLKSMMLRNGKITATVVEEFWLPLMYPTTANQILDTLKTGRRRDEFMILVTQSPEDAIQSPLLPTILQQTPTKILLPNPDAEFKTPDGGGYIRINVSEKEFQVLRRLGLQSRMFMIKQGAQASVVKLNLNSLSEYISVMAMSADEFPLLEQAKNSVGPFPDDWVPEYIKLRRAFKAQNKVRQPQQVAAS